MPKKPKHHEVQMAKKTLKRWYAAANSRNKETAKFEIKKIYEMLEYLEENTDWNIFEN